METIKFTTMALRMECHTGADCPIQEQPAFCFRTKSTEISVSAYPAWSYDFMIPLVWIATLKNPRLIQGGRHG